MTTPEARESQGVRPSRKIRRAALIAVLVAAVVVVSALVALRPTPRDPLKHDTQTWATIEDNKGDRIAVETSNATVWGQLVEMHSNGGRMWVGGVVERYDNAWGFRFRPGSIRISEVTAEGLQSTISGIASDLDYWINRVGQAYVWAGVVSIHTP